MSNKSTERSVVIVRYRPTTMDDYFSLFHVSVPEAKWEKWQRIIVRLTGENPEYKNESDHDRIVEFEGSLYILKPMDSISFDEES